MTSNSKYSAGAEGADGKLYGYNKRTGDYVYRIPGHRHGDGQIDSDEQPVWLLTDEQTAERAVGGDVPDIDPDQCE
jgi:hypothetical protein